MIYTWARSPGEYTESTEICGRGEDIAMNRKFLTAVMIFIIMSLLSISASPAGESTCAGEKSFLWKVRSKTGMAFIFGSVHLAKPEIYPLPRKVEESFAKSSVLAVEADPAKAAEPDVQQQMLLAALYTRDDTIQRHLSKKTYELATETMQHIGLQIETFRKTKPWFLALTIEALELQRLGYNPEYGLERHFAQEARGKKKLVELESFDYQIKLLSGFTEREQDLFLFYTLQDLKSLREEVEELMFAWRTGDVKTMESLATQTLLEYPEIRPIFDVLFYRRNRDMTDKIEQFLQSKDTVFVVVGAAHLVGKEGIIELLKKKGYSTEQM
jgi:uncharacterized protein YbaP (TraB family)